MCSKEGKKGCLGVDVPRWSDLPRNQIAGLEMGRGHGVMRNRVEPLLCGWCERGLTGLQRLHLIALCFGEIEDASGWIHLHQESFQVLLFLMGM